MAEYYRLGQWLRSERLKAGLGQREVNRILGKPVSFLYRVEHGLQRIDVIEFLDLIEAMGVTTNLTIDQIKKEFK